MAFRNYYGNKIIAETANGEVTFDDLNGVLSLYERPQFVADINSSGVWGGVGTGEYKCTYIQVAVGDTVRVDAGGARVRFVSEIITPAKGESASVVDGGIATVIPSGSVVPEGAKYMWVSTQENGNAPAWKHLYINDIDYALTIREEIRSDKYDNGVKWVAFGDSITQKYYSYFEEDGTVTTKESGWDVVYPNAVCEKNHWKWTNKGYGGMGWLMSSTGSTLYIAYNRIKEIDFTQYNLVTFAYGINDWKGNIAMGSLEDAFTYDEAMTPTTVIESMRYCFEYITSKNPNIKIIVITPLNCRGYSYDFGDDSTCWARGYTGFSNTGTLDEFADTMMKVCDSYGIECIDMTRNSVINKANIVQMLPDGVHPSAECHKMLGIELAKKINFC